MLELAPQGGESSYSLYSRFKVVAAIYAGDKIYQGANIENASYNSGICAVIVAIAHARIHQASPIEGIPIYCIDGQEDHLAQDLFLQQCLSCGACLQWLAELAPNAWIVTTAG